MPTCRSISVVVFLTLCPPLMAQTPTEPPMARQVEHISTWHGEKVNDPFFWLREKSNPEVIKYLEAENAYTEAMTKALKPFADALYQEMLGHIKQTDLDVPVRRGDYFYYSRTEEGKQYPIRCRKKPSPDGPPAAMARKKFCSTLNELAKGHKFLSLGAFKSATTPNGSPTPSTPPASASTGSTSRTSAPARSFPTPPNESPRSSWCRRQPNALLHDRRPRHQALKHALAARARRRESEPVYQEKDKLFTVHLGASKDQKMLFLDCRSTDTYEVRYLPSDQPEGPFQGRAAAPKGPQVHRRAPRRTLLHAHQQRCQELPPGDRAGREPVARATGKSSCPTGTTCCCKASSCSRTTWSRPRSRARSTIFACSISRAASGTPSTFPKPSTPLPPRPTPEYTSRSFRFQLSEHDHAGERLRLRHGQPAADAAQATGSSSVSTRRVTSPSDSGPSRATASRFRSRSSIAKASRKTARAPLFLYGYGSYGAGMQARFTVEPAQPARSRHGLRHRPHSRRQRNGRALARRRHAHEEEEHVFRLHRQRRMADRQQVDGPRPPRDRRRQRRRPA